MVTRLGEAAKMPFSVHPHMLRHACGYKLANEGAIPEPATLSRPQEHPAHRPLHRAFTRQVPGLLARLDWRPAPGRGLGASQTSLDVRAADATPGRGDFWILKIAHAPSPKNVFKNGFCPRKGVAFLWKAFLQKKFSGAGEDFDRIDGLGTQRHSSVGLLERVARFGLRRNASGTRSWPCIGMRASIGKHCGRPKPGHQ